MHATTIINLPGSVQISDKPRREAAVQRLFKLADLLLDETQWNDRTDSSDVEDKLQEIATMLGVCADQFEQYIRQVPLWTMESDLTPLAGMIRSDARVFVDIVMMEKATCMFAIKLHDLPAFTARLKDNLVLAG